MHTMDCPDKGKETSGEEHSQKEHTSLLKKAWQLMHEHRLKIHILASLAGIILLIFSILKLIVLDSGSATKAEVTDSSKTKVEVQNDINNIIGLDRLQSSDQQAENSSSERSDAPSHTVNKFTIETLRRASLIERIEESTAHVYDRSSKQNRIKLTYTGEIQKRSNGLYWYRGGHLKGMVDNLRCFVLRDVSISPTLREGNPRPSVKKHLRNEVADAVAQNQKKVVNNLIRCFQ